MGRNVSRRAGGALPPRLFASLSAPPGQGATRPYPRTPTRGKLSLQAFARCARVLRFAQGVLCSRTVRPAVFVLAHAATRRVRAGGALPPRRSLCSRSPGARGYAPLPPDPYPRQAELAGFCALRARAALRAGGFVLAHGATPMFVLAHASTRRVRADGALPCQSV